MTKVIIAGSRGRMGKMLIGCAAQFRDIKVVGEVDAGDDLDRVLPEGDVVVDFSSHTATLAIVQACAAHKKALVLGTTGHSEDERARVLKAAEPIPLVWTSNFSTGVNALFWLARHACRILGSRFDIEIVETHHRLKKDAPSGTARTLAEVLAEARGQQLQDVAKYGREGIIGERTPSEIGIHAVRGGDVVGDHTVLFAAVGERVELTHKASTRETFANGALEAARWVASKPAGLYTMQHVLGLEV